MQKVYGGKITLEVYTTVHACDDPTVERNNAHNECDSELFQALRKVVENRGFHSNFVGADLHLIDDVSNAELNLVNHIKKKAKEKRERSTLRIQL